MPQYFNLLDEPWLSVRIKSGETVSLGLLDIFKRGSEIVFLAETSPPSLVAEYRLLLAILHRALTQAFPVGWKGKDRARWYREGLPFKAICDYLEKWRDRFWLFHPENPFMQVAALVSDEAQCDKHGKKRDVRKPWMQIALECPDANSPVLFDHSHYGQPRPIAPADAIARLLGYLQFAPPGKVLMLHQSGSGNDGPLRSSAALIALGGDLSQTLILNLHPYEKDRDSDLPAWERGSPELSSLGRSTLATGYNDRYTRQTRAALFLREPDGDIKQLLFASGLELINDLNAPDPMVSYQQGNKGPIRLSFSEGRALWRDLPVLVPSKGGASIGAGILNWALGLHAENGEDITAVYQKFSVAGVSSKQAKVIRWRNERIELPLSIIGDYDKHKILNDLIGKSEDLYRSLRELAKRMIAELMPAPSNTDTLSRASQIFDTGPFAGRYFSRVEIRVAELIQFLKQGRFDDAELHWNEVLRDSSIQAWGELTLSMGLSSVALRSQIKFESRFYQVLEDYCPKPSSVNKVDS